MSRERSQKCGLFLWAILLDDDTRKYISVDDKNQYLIIGRNPKNLFATKENLFELVSEKVGEQTVFTIEAYM